jgi:hypothetical protein
MHVDNFYHHDSSSIRLDNEQQDSLQLLETPYLPDSVIGLLPEASGDSVKTLLKHTIAYAIFSRTVYSTTNDVNDSLLPTGLYLMLQYLLGTSNSHQEGIECQWKAMTVSIMHIASTAKSSEMKSKINRLSDQCVRALQPWSLSRYGLEARRSHLVRIMEEAVELGLTMFGEEKGWLVWQWEANEIDARRGDMVVFPGLELRQSLNIGRTGSRTEADRRDSQAAQVVLAPTTATLQL